MSKQIKFRILLWLLILVGSLFSWFLIKISLAQDLAGLNENWFLLLVLPALSFLFVAFVAGLAVLVESNKKFLWATSLFVVLPFFIFFGIRIYSAVAGTIAIILLTLGLLNSFEEKSLRLRLTVGKIARKAMVSLTLVLPLLVSVGFYYGPANKSIAAGLELPRPVFDVIYGPFEKIIGAALVKGINQEVPQIYQSRNAIADQIYFSVNQYLNNLGRPYLSLIPFGLATALFFTLKFIGWIFVSIAVFFVYITFEILKKTGLVKLKAVETVKEVIEI